MQRYIFFAFFVLCTASLSAQQVVEQSRCMEPESSPVLALPSWHEQLDGKNLPAHGQLHALVIFAQFPDDSLDIEHPEWPKDQPPRLMNQWVDSIWTGTPTPYSMTDYFNDMSLGKLKFTGKTRFVTAPRTRQQYRSLGLNRQHIHTEIIQKLDSTLDFAEFDRWDPETFHVHREQPDKYIDLVIVIWRNIADDISNQSDKNAIIQNLDFEYDEANLAYRPTELRIQVDEGRRIVNLGEGMDYNLGIPYGAGVTLRKPYTRTPFMSEMKTTVHEVAHHFFGSVEYHVGFGFWGMVSSAGIRNFTANSFERHRLGWINLILLDSASQIVTGAQLPDYVTTGVAYAFVIDSVYCQYFYIENHQGISRWDRNMDGSPMERGVYVLHKTKPYGPLGDFSQMRMIAADGRYDWSANRKETHSCCGAIQLPVLIQGEPNRHTGYHDCEHIRFWYTPLGQIDPEPTQAILLEDHDGNTVHYDRISGDGLDAFRMGYQQVFSPWSNPNSQKVIPRIENRGMTSFGFELTAVDTTSSGDVYTLDLYPQGAVAASPAKVQAFSVSATSLNKAALSWQANEEPDLKWYNIYRATVISPNEPPASSYQLIATLDARNAQGTPITSWTDTTVNVGGQTLYRLYYKIAAVDSTDKESVRATTWIYNAPPPLSSGKQSALTSNSTQDIVVHASPNPFDTDLLFSLDLPVQQRVLLQLVDIFGRPIGVVLDAVLEAGHHDKTFHVEGLPGTACFYRLQTDIGVYSGLLLLQR